MTSHLRPMPFFIGLIGGLLTLALVGATIESEPLKTASFAFTSGFRLKRASIRPPANSFQSRGLPRTRQRR